MNARYYLRRWLFRGAVGSVVTVAGIGTYLERPIADIEDGIWYNARGQIIKVTAQEDDWRIIDEHTRWENWLRDQKVVSTWGLQMMQGIIVRIVTVLGHFVLRVQNELKILNCEEKDDDAYEKLIQIILNRDPSIGLLTISNHTSVLDDPFLLAALTPLQQILVNPQKSRWAACSQEVCFSRGALISAFFGAGNTLPIKRGGGLDQPALKALAQKLAQGKWVHIFPEGHVFQGTEIGSGRGSHGENNPNIRSESSKATIGALKWGTAKLIAHAPQQKLIVIPMIHHGMNSLMPYDKIGKCESKLWRSNQHVTLTIGQPLEFDDLILQHERQFNTSLLQYSSSYKKEDHQQQNQEDTLLPDSSESDKILYALISRRIEAALVALHADHYNKIRLRSVVE
mmetsp:Transcript_12146/g.16437  ORF Transcript_12146/g.16437 Transcript_12146/m.16437 type:complete len:398 (+) Transcript_12146:152-1345(+)|eukprot:CAMPEP_0197285304 /NCGR_PEP_ID=MMETSP0890-20130614/520_1 /TAXON_ID=44058 ORGANISM="Aureoumbra lagunensis, Strain CCMP1510" /NCGR_SAMPLE_ID=MMETSP0890 /ASSEMBLY_ACC=CAM_ASM_000533 /LENGTH=397 /DNA_ID=CAMNT_0042752655 /DNA_START=135 /DNA_END=1328 /DNA_ORIENTATION=-